MSFMIKRNSTKNFFIIIAGILLVGYIFVLISITYLDKKKIEIYQNNEIESNIKNRAITLEHFLNSIQSDFTDIYEKKAMTMYFANKDLGMSMQYGLKASINRIQRLLNEFLLKKNINGIKTFKEISIFDIDNKLLATTNKDKYIDLKKMNLEPSFTTKIIVKETNTGLTTYLFRSLYYKDKLVGNIISTINLQEIFNTLINVDNTKLFLSAKNRELDKNSLSFDINDKLTYFSIPINNTAYTISGLRSFEGEESLYSQWIELALSFLSIPILISIYYLIILNNKNIKLEEEKNTERLLLQQSKVAAIGEMLGNISHQWRQPLSVISSYATGLKLLLEFQKDVTEEKIISDMNKINDQTQYLAKTIDDFRNFFSGDSNNIQRFNIKDLFLTLENLTRDSLVINHIKFDYKVIDFNIVGNENILMQALLNIINNARDALVDNIHLTEDRYLFINVKKHENTIVIKIKDSGGGIPSSIVDKIYEPYFTSKHESIGTGIGLYMTNQIITKQYNGKIIVDNVVYNVEGKVLTGAEFKLVLPIEENTVT